MYSREGLNHLVIGWRDRLKSLVEKGNPKRKRLIFAPYDLSIYQNLLIKISNEDRYAVTNLDSYSVQATRNRAQIILRHDIDTLDCIVKMNLLLEEDLKHGFRPGVYLRVDGEAYSLREWKGLIETYHRRGIPFGLHSVCYTSKNYLGAFREETAKFVNETGIIPRSFTLHGLGKIAIENRLEFIKKSKQIGLDHGYRITDCSEDFISYRHVIQDCYSNAANGRRYILKDFVHLPKFLNGECYLILTHPCYWKNETHHAGPGESQKLG